MSYETIRIDTDHRGVTYLTLNRPEKRNALSRQMIDELTAALAATRRNPDARIVVFRAEGGAFCAGGDLDWMRQQFDADRAERITEARRLAQLFKLLNELPLPVIGRIHGDALGGGVGIICACDVAIASDTARFGLTETRLGLIPATIAPYVIARLGEGKARRVFMSARVFAAEEAAELGVVAKAVPAAELDNAIEAEIQPYLETASAAVASAKSLARALGMPITDTLIEMTIDRLADTWESHEAREGIQAFFERRKPGWARKDERQ